MKQPYQIPWDQIEWQSPQPGARFKVFRDQSSKQVRLLELSPEFVEVEWCHKGHVGFVISGELEIDFTGKVVRFPASSGIVIPAGAEHAHKARAITPVVRLFLVEQIADELPRA